MLWQNDSMRALKTIATAALMICIGSEFAIANPVLPIVVNGSAVFPPQGPTLTVTNTPGAVINWQSFSIGAGETTRFVQQSSASTVLNRTTGQNKNFIILGRLVSNGQLFLVNPNGSAFTPPGRRLDVVAGTPVAASQSPKPDLLPQAHNFQVRPLAANQLSINLSKREPGF